MPLSSGARVGPYERLPTRRGRHERLRPAASERSSRAAMATKLFDGQYYVGQNGRTYDVSRDGQRFLMIKDVGVGERGTTTASMVVVLNWFEELKARVPAR